jgi:hypothetical protein
MLSLSYNADVYDSKTAFTDYHLNTPVHKYDFNFSGPFPGILHSGRVVLCPLVVCFPTT